MEPLAKLISGNLRHAHKLGMIESEKALIDKHLKNLEGTWDPAESPDAEYLRCMNETKSEFDRRFRPIQAFKGKTVPFSNVMRLASFSKYWLDSFDPSISDTDATGAKKCIETLSLKTTPASATDISVLRDALIKFNQWLRNPDAGAANQGLPITIGPLLDPATRPFWVGGRVQSKKHDAQYWRDRLGLIHFNTDEQTCKNLLVRLRFAAKMANEDLPRSQHLEHRKSNPDKLWLFRPSVLHGGNRRFVQGVAADRPNRPSRRGSTRDLAASADYSEGERELLLLTGELSEVRFVGIDLLDGFVITNSSRDADDAGFVESIKRQLAWD